MKKIVIFLLSIMLFSLSSCYNQNDNNKISDIKYFEFEEIYIQNKVYCALKKYTGSEKEVTIPEKYNEKEILKISKEAFYNKKCLESVYFKGNIIEIEDSAFEKCSNLKEIVLNDELKKIGYGAFRNCTNLVKINLPSNLEEIKSNSFAYCINLRNITLPNKLKILGDNCFYKTGIRKIIIPKSVIEFNGVINFNGYCDIYNLSSLDISKYNENRNSYIHLSLDEKPVIFETKNYNSVKIDNEYYMIDYFSNEKTIVLPQFITYYDGISESYILKDALCHNDTAENVIINKGIEKVINCFISSNNLKEIFFSSSVKHIEDVNKMINNDISFSFEDPYFWLCEDDKNNSYLIKEFTSETLEMFKDWKIKKQDYDYITLKKK